MIAIRVVAALLVCCAVLLARPASGQAEPAADPLLARASAAFAELRYDEALHLLDELWRKGTSDPRQLRQIFELAGRAAGVIGEAEAARTWFARWLSLDPDAALPEGTSPKLTQFLIEARARLGGVQLDVRATRRAGSDEVKLALVADPIALITAVRAGDVRASIEAARITTPARQLELLDRHGNVVAVIPVADATAAGTPNAPQGKWHARWSTWAIVAGVTAAAGGVSLAFAARADARLDELAKNSAEHDFAEVLAEERSLERAQWIARIGLGAAVASAAVATILYLREDEPGPVLTASPTGVALSWGGTF